MYGSYYAQGVVADSPNPNAAQLWIEHILSDEGALGYLQGGAIPARYEALVDERDDHRGHAGQPAAGRPDRPDRSS